MFFDLGHGLARKLVGGKSQEHRSNQCQVCQQSGISTSGSVFSEEHVTAPMIADLDPCPVASDQLVPLSRVSFGGIQTTQIVACFLACLPAPLDVSLTANHHDAPGIGEVHLHPVGRERGQFSGFDPPVASFSQDKKGVPGVLSFVLARFSRLGWFALICRRYLPPFSTMVRATLR